MADRFPRNRDEANGAAKGVFEARVALALWCTKHSIQALDLDETLYRLEHSFWSAKCPKKAKKR